MKQDDLLHKWVEGTLTEEEASRFRQREEYADLLALSQSVGSLEAPGFDKQAMLQQILATPKEEQPTPVRRLNSRTIAFAVGIAASLLLLSIIFWPRSNGTQQYITQASDAELVASFPDGSAFVLSQSSQLEFDADKWADNRSVNLKGEAQFSVEKGAPFSVNTPTGSVQVLGTVFEVKEEGESLRVICQEGKVAVFSTAGKALDTLVAGQFLLVNEGKIVKSWDIPVASAAREGWEKPISQYESAQVSLLLAEIEARYGVVIVGDIPDISLRANIPHDNLERALSNVLFAAEASYSFSDTKDTIFVAATPQ